LNCRCSEYSQARNRKGFELQRFFHPTACSFPQLPGGV
jgi:hypothetical protein